MKKLLIYAISLFTALILTAPAMMANPGHIARTFNIHDGLPSGDIATVAQDDRGLIWLGTWNGLSFYDGYRIYTFRSGNTTGRLTTNRIMELQPDSLDNVWFLTYGNRLNLFDKASGRFVNLAEMLPKDAKIPNMRRLHRGEKAIWASNLNKSEIIRINYNPKSKSGYDIDWGNVGKFIPGARSFEGVVSAGGHTWILTDNAATLEGTKTSIKGHPAGIADADGTPYIITVDGHLFAYADGKAQALPTLSDFGKVAGIAADSAGHLAAATSAGYALYNIKTRKWDKYPIEAGISMIVADSNNRVWMFSPSGRTYLAGRNAAPEAVEMAPNSGELTNFFTPFIFEDRFGTVWLAPENGNLAYYDEASGRVIPQPLLLPSLRYTALPLVERFFTDSNKNLWVYGNNGLTLVNFNYRNFKNIPVERNYDVRSVLATRNGELLAGSSNGALAHYGADGNFIGYITTGATPDGVVSHSPTIREFADKIYSLYESPDGSKWVGTKGTGMYQITPDSKVRHYSRVYSGDRNIVCDTIYDFDTDSKGRLWAASYSKGPLLGTPAADGTLRFTPIATLPQYPKDEQFKFIRRITHNDLGEMILSTNAGIVTFKDDFKSLSDIKFSASVPDVNAPDALSTATVMQVLNAKNGYYVTTLGGHVQKINNDRLTGEKLRFSKSQSTELDRTLSRGNVLSMIQDKEGSLYFVRETDIVRFSPSDSTISVLGSGTLGRNYEFSEALPAIDNDGNLYFGALGSVVKLNPRDINTNPQIPEIIFTGIQFQGDDQDRVLLPSRNIVIEPDNRDFAITFTSKDFSVERNTEYAYRFDSDKEWTYIGTDNTLRLTGLQPGLRRLYVKSTNADGTWVDNQTFIDIMVKPRFSETIWAKLLWILLAIVLIAAVIWVYYNHRRNKLMQQLSKRERDFYVSASHKLRTPLSLIGSPVYEVLKNENLSDDSRENLERVRRNAKNMLDVLNSMLENEFKSSGLYDADTAGSGGISENSDVVEKPSYMLSENWLEVKDEEGKNDKQDTTILIVEDNDDLRGFLRDILKGRYNILTAANGKEGLKIAESGQPDFILTDVMMPEMDGLTMVKKIKSNEELSHIPIIVLSAKTSLSDRIEGLKAGIDDYISKPFSASLLRQRIANIIAQRAMLQRTYLEKLSARMNGNAAPAQQDTAEPDGARKPYRLESPQIIETDHIMMEQLMEFIEERISDENLRIEEMAESVGMGRTVFYGKIKSIVGMSPSDFLRTLRMQRAEDLIVKSGMNFSQIAFSVGFSDPKYFTKCFKKETGMTPSEYRKQNRHTQEYVVPDINASLDAKEAPKDPDQ